MNHARWAKWTWAEMRRLTELRLEGARDDSSKFSQLMRLHWKFMGRVYKRTGRYPCLNAREELEAARHELTVVYNLSKSSGNYYCEDCGAFVQIRCGFLRLFHVPYGSPSTPQACRRPSLSYARSGGIPNAEGPKLADKIKHLQDDPR